MADSSQPRLSGSSERTPFLSPDPGPDTPGNQRGAAQPGGVHGLAEEPLTPLTKVLLILSLVLLLVSSVFIGLFAGVQHKLNLERGRHDGNTTTSTILITTTAVSTFTRVITTTSTSMTTTTTITTTTIVPNPVPTAPPQEPVPERACITSQCVLLAGSILASLDISQDPCENFYKFATGGWLRAHPLPADKSSFGNFEALAQTNTQVVQRILESKDLIPDSPPDTEILHKLRDFYSSCLNEQRLDEIGTVPLSQLVKTLRKIYKGEFHDQSTIGASTKTDLTAVLAYLHSQGIESFFSFAIEGDIGKDPNRMILWFSQASLGLPSKEYYKDEKVLKAYQASLERLLLTLSEEEISLEPESNTVFSMNAESQRWPPWPWPPWGDEDEGGEDKPKNRTRWSQKIVKKVVELEKKLADASLDLDILLQDPLATYNPVPLYNLTDGLPQVDFSTYFSAFNPRTFPDRVVVTYPPYIASLSQILAETSVDTIEAYLILRSALALSPYLGMETEAWQAQRSLQESLTGIKKGAVGDRAEYCINKVEEMLGFAVGRYFVNETFTGNSRQVGINVIQDIIETFKASLLRLDWMDKPSAKAAAEKADAIRVKVGFPLSPDTRDASSIARYYHSVKVDDIHFFENMINAAKDRISKQWLQLGRQRNLESWEMFPSTVNAYFNPPANEIVFPAGILQPPFFDATWPAYISYGSFGHVAAHELTHAFDSAGRLYNQQGKLEQWWSNKTNEGFQVKQDCIVKQYSAYTIDDGKGGKIHINGNLTSGENIGDTGLIQAYRAWKKQFAASFEAGNEELLPGLNFTREQLFFISFARIWARAMKPEAAVQRVRTDPHSPSKYRVDGTVYNIPEFAEAFKCSKNAKLNPPMESRCIFWS